MFHKKVDSIQTRPRNTSENLSVQTVETIVPCYSPKFKNKYFKTYGQRLRERMTTVFCCVCIIVFGITFLTKADPITTSIGENISTNDLSVGGTITSGSWAGTAIDIAYGGTGQDWSTATQGSFPYFSDTGILSTLSAGTAGQFLQSGGGGANPSWANVTRSATFVIAASDSSTLSKQQADYVCDGVDDQVEILTAISAVPLTGGTVLLLEGNYLLTNRIYPTTQRTNLWLIGYGAKLIGPSDIAFNQIINFHSTYAHNSIHIRGLEIDGNAKSIGGIRLSASNSDVADCYIHNVASSIGIHIWGEGAHQVDNVKIYNNRIIGTSETMEYGIHLWGSVNNIAINSNLIQNTKYNGVALYGSSATNLVVTENTMVNTGHSAIAASPSSYGTISNNLIYDITTTDEAGIEIEYKLSHGTDTSHHFAISGNVIKNCFWGIVTHNRDDDFSKSPHDIVIVGNIVSGCERGIYLYDGENILVSDNVFEDNTADMIIESRVSAKVTQNIGYTTENSGTSTIATGQTSITVTHGLATTPTRVQLTPSTLTDGKDYYISAKTATTFTITIDSVHTSDISFDWRAVVGEGN
ncbi:MAG: right-handed parallel beta-helix repeat-containing protein [Candidatus Pacebacteria bacterium]|nr:right-handed parallel beta-helix repeat-containing protein [Candidatus Paceibacterota bacterium]